VIPEETGVLFPDPAEESLAQAVYRAERIRWSARRIRGNANPFNKEKFIARVTGTKTPTI